MKLKSVDFFPVELIFINYVTGLLVECPLYKNVRSEMKYKT